MTGNARVKHVPRILLQAATPYFAGGINFPESKLLGISHSSEVAGRGVWRFMVLEARQISKQFGGVAALSAVDFDLQVGEVHALVGENGAGKSTLLKILFGVMPPDGGEIWVEGTPRMFRSPHDAQAAGIAMIHQELSLITELSIAQNIFFGREGRGQVLHYRQLEERAAPLLEQVGLNASPGTKVKTLSIADQQMVEIARGLSQQARILIMDEPTSSLSPREVKRLQGVIQSLLERGVGVIYVSHHLEEVQTLANRVTVLRDGKLVANFEQGVSRNRVVAAMVGRDVGDERTRTTTPSSAVALSVRGLERGKAFQDISFEVREGEVVTLAGLVGAGRTEVLRGIMGADRVARGEVMLHGQVIANRNPLQMVKAGVGFVPEDRRKQGIVPDRAMWVNLLLAAWARNLLPVSGRAAMSTVSKYTTSLGIRPRDPNLAIRRFSGGNQQKILLARALAAKCNVLLIDEPTRGIDVAAKSEIYALIERLADEGTAILLVSSELPEVLRLSDRILVMRQGRLAGELGRSEANEEKIIALATGVEHASW
jgi:ribose transport system ATP-binding protein